MIELAAYIACAVLTGLMVFQAALILGAPIGRFAWGGMNKVLPAKLRAGSGVAIVLYVIFAIFILDKSGLLDGPVDNTVVSVGMWVITGYFVLGVFMNGISRSKSERAVMTPVAAVLAISFLVVALK